MMTIMDRIRHYSVRIFLTVDRLLGHPFIRIVRSCFPGLLKKKKDEGRLFSYPLHLLPNSFIRNLESISWDRESAIRQTGLSIGYPAWNLLYYALFCSLVEKQESWTEQDAVIVETGTNLGFSTIILAQALKDSGAKGRVYTVDIDQRNVEIAKRNVERSGLGKYVKFYNEDSAVLLPRLIREMKYLDFILLDADHSEPAVLKEFQSLYETVAKSQGKVYFDNTSREGVAKALKSIKQDYGGNLIEFQNCSWAPPGNAIWQPDQFWVVDEKAPVIKELVGINWSAVQYDYFPKDRRMRILDEKKIPGMNTENIRFLINELVKRFAKEKVYLEVGTYQGSSLLSAALFNPYTRCIGIDNFSQFRNREIQLRKNLELFNECKNIKFYNMDYKAAFKKLFSEDPDLKIAVYFYDGYHSYEEQKDGLDLMLPHLADQCIILVDDINWRQVEMANESFLDRNSDFRSVFKIKTKTNHSEDWWNGFEVIARGI